MNTKFVLALLHITFCLAFDLSEFKMPLYALAGILAMISIYEANPNFGFLEYMLITFISIFIKGFVLEMYLHNKNSFLDPKMLKLALYLLIAILILGNPFVIKRISSLIKRKKALKFGLSLSAKIAQCIQLSTYYHHVLSQPEPSLLELAIITTIGFSISNLVLYLSLLEEKSQMEAFTIIQSSFLSNFKMYWFAFINLYLWHFYVKQNVGFKVNEINSVRIVTSLSFVVFSTIQSMMSTQGVVQKNQEEVGRNKDEEKKKE